MEPVVNVVLPVFGIILAGYLAGRFRLLGDASSEALNRFVYYVALPVLLFHSMAVSEPARILDTRFLAAYGGAQVATFAIAALVAAVALGRRLAESALHGMTAVFGNTGYMGIPLAAVAFGGEGTVLAVVATAFQSAVIVAIVVALVEIDFRRRGGVLVIAVDVILAMLRNPLFVVPILGLAWSLAGLTLPVPVDAFCRILGAAAGPSALFAIGLFLVGKPIFGGFAEVGLLAAFKLVIQPAATLWLAVTVFETDPLATTVSVIMAAMPAGANCFVLAQQYKIAVERTSAAILATTILSVVTVSALFAAWGVGVRP